MKRTLLAVLACTCLAAVPLASHNLAAGIVDQEIQALNGAPVPEIPSAGLSLGALGAGSELTSPADRLQTLEDLIAGDVLTTAALLQGRLALPAGPTSGAVAN